MATADPLTITITLPSAAAIPSGTLECRTDPLVTHVWPHNHAYAQVSPSTTLATHAGRAEWGGVVICRPLPDLADDLQTLTDFGFRVLGNTQRAGETYVYVFGGEILCRNWVSDIPENKRLRAHFAPYPAGALITLEGVLQNWNEGRRLIV